MIVFIHSDGFETHRYTGNSTLFCKPLYRYPGI